MARDLILVENKEDWLPEYGDRVVITAREYITEKQYSTQKSTRVINLCRDYKYLSKGYFCSLLAEARGHKVIPSMKTILELDKYALYRHSIPEFERLARQELSLLTTPEDTLKLNIFWGFTDQPQLSKLAMAVFGKLRCPLMRITLQRDEGKWHIQSIRSQPLNAISENMKGLFVNALQAYARQRWAAPKIESVARYDLAILHDPSEPFPPSDQKVLEKFIRIGKTMDMSIELIQKKDFSRLYEFDALFIRETTGIDHHTFRFAKKAEREGMVVIDDSEAILKCTNKVYLAELLKTHKVKTPHTVICDYNGLEQAAQQIAYPIVLKIPDGSFSRGVHKAETQEELEQLGTELLKESDLILAQEYIYTEFDWRIGILNNEPLFACQYYMSKKHWQIYKHEEDGKCKWGQYTALPIEEVPQTVLQTALMAAKLIGDGFYGVDLKQRGEDVFVIEVNDNPSIDTGVEDAYLKDELYRKLLSEFTRRLDIKWAINQS